MMVTPMKFLKPAKRRKYTLQKLVAKITRQNRLTRKLLGVPRRERKSWNACDRSWSRRMHDSNPDFPAVDIQNFLKTLYHRENSNCAAIAE